MEMHSNKFSGEELEKATDQLQKYTDQLGECLEKQQLLKFVVQTFLVGSAQFVIKEYFDKLCTEEKILNTLEKHDIINIDDIRKLSLLLNKFTNFLIKASIMSIADNNKEGCMDGVLEESLDGIEEC